MRVALLGPVRAYADDGAPIDVGGPMQRALLARLALSAGQVVAAGSLIDALWGEHPPADAGKAMHALVYRLRKALGEPALLESAATGYRLKIDRTDVDGDRFEELAARGRRELAAGSARQAAASLREALALWRGTALADVADAPFAGTAAARLAELRLAAAEDRFQAELELGRHAEILADLETEAARHPLRERLAALRMRALHAAGRQAAALDVFEQVRRTLADQLGVDPGREVQEAHLAVLRGTPAASPGRLPARLTGFVGRDDELRLLAELMESARLITIAGPGGAGKTRLAVEAAGRHRTHRRGRAWLVPLAAATTPEEVADAVLGALGPTGAAARPIGPIADLLGGGEALLVLDNCEQAAAAVARFAGRLLERLPHLTILATSRESLEVMGEAVCRLGPLPLPLAHAGHVRAADSPAVRLFLDRAAAVRPGFALDEGNVRDVVDIVRRLDGLPLALELAAARLRTMSPGQIARRLDDRFRLLASGNRTAQPRQQTLHAVIDWSWNLLTDQERALARRISFFPAMTGAAAIEAVCAGHDLPEADVPYVLDSLVGKSIVERTADSYRMLETIRAYAAERLDQAGERERTRDRFTRHFAALAEELEPLLRSDRQAELLRRFASEYDNLIGALRIAIDVRDATTAARMLGSLFWYWDTLRYDGRAKAYVRRVLEFGDALPADARAACTAIHLMAGEGGPVTDPERVRAVIDDCRRTGALERYPMLPTLTLMTAHLLGMDELVDQELARTRAGADRWAIAGTLVVQAVRRRERGDWHGSAALLQEALHIYEETGDQWWTATLLAGTARPHSVAGDTDRAIAAYGRSIALVAALSPHETIAHRLGLATERMRAGDTAAALRDIETAERAAWESGRPELEVEVLFAFADLHHRQGEIERSDRVLDQVERSAREIPLPEQAIDSRLVLARMANLLARGDAAGARELRPRSLEAAYAHLDPALAAQLGAGLALLEGDPRQAAVMLGMSQAIRGAFDQGDALLRSLAARLTDELGQAGYEQAYREGAGTPRDEAAERLARP
ncbi:AfsR/SARP family transcriptional regulator [Spongiactinospora rosea]|uniref:AfsR/SARP family transcriptional regulator n=1 Tax=Spongiactinospora rosea TaxID=2248750 RepID=A0A366LJU0_9ACTN|nr:BTAD domain-containing putative transcriptional regulator [Spongiactinospora rosea]RBQ14131.1 AfsR/SARP family transcriptional regulator [Spongiactinospora rosea]